MSATLCPRIRARKPRPTAPPVPRVRLRMRSAVFFRHTRRVKGGAWQARVWLGAAQLSLNLGLFTCAEHPSDPGRPQDEMAEWAAGRASREFRKRWRPGVSLQSILSALIDSGIVPERLLPPRVRRAGEGLYIGRVKKAGRVIETPELYADPWDAYRAMLDVLREEFPEEAGRYQPV